MIRSYTVVMSGETSFPGSQAVASKLMQPSKELPGRTAGKVSKLEERITGDFNY